MSAKYFNLNLGDAPPEVTPVWRETTVNSFQCKGLRKSMDTRFVKLKMQNNITAVLSSFRRRHRADIEHFAPTPEELSRLLEQT